MMQKAPKDKQVLKKTRAKRQLGTCQSFYFQSVNMNLGVWDLCHALWCQDPDLSCGCKQTKRGGWRGWQSAQQHIRIDGVDQSTGGGGYQWRLPVRGGDCFYRCVIILASVSAHDSPLRGCIITNVIFIVFSFISVIVQIV